MNFNQSSRSASSADGWLEDLGLRPELQLVTDRSLNLFGALFLTISCLHAKHLILASLLGGFLASILFTLLLENLVFRALFWRHSGDLHGLNLSIDCPGSFLELLQITGELIAIIRRHCEAQCNDQIIDTTLQTQNLLDNFSVGALEAVELGLFWALELVFDKLLQE